MGWPGHLTHITCSLCVSGIEAEEQRRSVSDAGEDVVCRAGHGRSLLNLAEAFAREAGCGEARSNAAADAIGFYERCGYSRDLSMPTESGNVPMLKLLV
jgi:hypothetical protein